MTDALVLNVVAILIATTLGGFLGKEDYRLFAAWGTFCLTVDLSIIGWVVYVAAHFIGKYW